MTTNAFCDSKSLTNEASVETFFLLRLLNQLGYQDPHIKTKQSVKELRIQIGTRKLLYKPDYAIKVGGVYRWIIDAKSPQEPLEKHLEQCFSYCSMLNRTYQAKNPIEYFVISNGMFTRIYKPDSNVCLLELRFEDFHKENKRYQRLLDMVSLDVLRSTGNTTSNIETHILYKRSLEEVNSAFSWCHQHVHKKDALSQAAAFSEFVKVIFLKLLSDRRIRNKYLELIESDIIEIPAEDVTFSVKWLVQREKDTPNPLNSIEFRNLLTSLESEIAEKKKKRMFDANSDIDLSPGTIKGIVAKLEDFYLLDMDADLNGRLFETFLNATMRGKDLGQFFTPRSIVKLATKLARLRADADHLDVVLDACCGTGGFLIEALADMWGKIDSNGSIGVHDKEQIRTKIANEKIYGVDFGREPPVARIARVNMYLHGDGGSKIFQADALDKKTTEYANDSAELKAEKAKLRELFQAGSFADVVLTNPPFAKTYDRKDDVGKALLESYDLAVDRKGSKEVPKKSLRSSVMFLERYYDLLKSGGRLITVIDDSILGSKTYVSIRKYIRDKFIVQGIVSLPGDAFQRSKARVKTSLLILVKREKGDSFDVSSHPSVFMFPCRYIGIDDPDRQRTLPKDIDNRLLAEKEIEDASVAYLAFLGGEASSSKWTVPASRIHDRMDVKSCLPQTMNTFEEKQDVELLKMSDLISIPTLSDEDILETKGSDSIVSYLRVRYDGFAERGEEIIASQCKYPELYYVHMGQIVISNIGATHGSICIVPERLDGCVVTNEYTILQTKEGVDNLLVWLLLRSPESRAKLLLQATGISRTRVRREHILSLVLPEPPADTLADVLRNLQDAEEKEKEVEDCRRKAQQTFESKTGLNTEEARAFLQAFKPPQ